MLNTRDIEGFDTRRREVLAKIAALEKYSWIFRYIVAILFVALLLNFLMWLPIPTFGTLRAEHWLGFWGSYLGGALGCLPAIAALVENRKESRRLHEETERDRHFSRLPMIDGAVERISSDTFFDPNSVDAVMSITYEGTSFRWKAISLPYVMDLQKENTVFLLRMNNIGFGPALDLNITFLSNAPFSIGTLQEQHTFQLLVSIPPEMLEGRIGNHIVHQLAVSFKDILEWRYVQHQEFRILEKKAIFSPISSPTHTNS